MVPRIRVQRWKTLLVDVYKVSKEEDLRMNLDDLTFKG